VRWANELFAEIEEQIERTIISNLFINFKKLISREPYNSVAALLAFMIILITIVAPLAYLSNRSPGPDKDFLLNSDIDHILSISQNANSNDDKINVLYQYNIAKLRNIVNIEKTLSFIDIVRTIDIKNPIHNIAMYYYYLRSFLSL